MMPNLKKIAVTIMFALLLAGTYACKDVQTTTEIPISSGMPTIPPLSTVSSDQTSITSLPSTAINPLTTGDYTTYPDTTTITTTRVITTANQSTSETVTYQESLSLTPPSKQVYSIGENLDYGDMEITYTDYLGQQTLIDHQDCLIEHDQLDTYGQKTVYVSYNDMTVSFAVTYNLPSYYLAAQNKSDDALKAALNTILNTGLVRKTYGDSRYILDDTDRDPLIFSNVILVYLGTSVSGVWDEGATWNREHVWPQSLLGTDASNSTKNVASDLHNLKPANPGENERRSNKYFANEPWPYVKGYPSYCPRDEVKGDVARILFYMVVMYEEPSLDLELVNHSPSLYQMGMLDILLSWHEQDPVDEFERNRNEMIFAHQKNRNPFIDYPPFADLIWGN